MVSARVEQVNVDGLDAQFPPLVSVDAFPNNLPQQVTDFIGRDAELEETKRILLQTRLLTILAPGGTGKTRLAIQTAADVIADYPDGVFFIALADISSSRDIVQTVAESIGVALSSAEDPQTQLLSYLASRRLLLVFDNFEHVQDGVGIVSEILKAAADVTVIATSRSRLQLTGETVLTLAGLAATWDSPAQALETPGVRLFLDAARRSQPEMSLTQDDLEPLAEILRLTGGMPLGILLAAAWVNVLSVGDIAAEIAKSLDFLETNLGDVPDRHRSVRAVFDYTWGLLDTGDREVFAALSVFRGGFTREAADAVAGASLRDLADLAGKSLVAASPDTGRYSIHELLRQYAKGELEKDPPRSDEVVASHADYYADVTEGAIEGLPADHRMLELIERDIENIRTAWRHNIATRNAGGVQRMIRGLFVLYDMRGWYQAAMPLFAEALDAWAADTRDETGAIVRAAAVGLHNSFSAMLGRPEASDAAAELAVAAMREFGDAADLFLALWAKAITLLYLGRPDIVVDVIDEAISLGESSPEWASGAYWAGGIKNLRAFAALSTGDMESAKRLLDESRKVLEPLDERVFMAWNLAHRGRIALGEGRLDDAIDLFDRSAERSREVGFLRALQVALAALGRANPGVGNLEAAEAALIESLDAAERTSMVPEVLGTLTQIASTFALRGRRGEAVELLATVLAAPASSRKLITDTTTIGDLAQAELDRLEPEMEADEYSGAKARGQSRPYGVAAKELIDTLS